MSVPASSRWDHEVRLLALLAICVSVFSFLFYFRHGDVLLYGDAVAHINIARRVFDSKTPGPLQLGTVWLPLPHLLMIPFLIFDGMWRNGVGGSLPSMVAYVFGVLGMFRLVRGVLSAVPTGLTSTYDSTRHFRAGLSHAAATRLESGASSPSAHPPRSAVSRSRGQDRSAMVAGWTAAAIYGANPNLIYMQTTAMGEALYLALFIWAVVYFSEFVCGEQRALSKCGLCLAAACLTRYDGWFLAAGMVAGAVVVSHPCKKREDGAPRPVVPTSRMTLVKFVLIAVVVPALWLAYNAAVYRNPLEFENGPYSAKAIEKRTASAGSPGHPGTGKLYAAGLYFLKAGEFNLAENQWLQRLWVLMALVGIMLAGFPPFAKNAKGGAPDPHSHKECEDGAPKFWWPLLLLWVPLPFYALSVAYGGVPIFIPAWWPFTHYNARYGLQLLPAFAASAAILAYAAARSELWHGKLRRLALLGVFVLVIAGYASIWRAEPICYREASINMRGRTALERQLAKWLKDLPPNSTLLMYLGEHPGALQQAGVPLKRVINEGNHRVWKQPIDPEGLWERALANPSEFADYVVAFEGDDVWHAVQGRHLPELVEISVTGQRRAILYRAR